jgi:hypothetical protein
MISCDHVIAGTSKGGLNQTTFFPAIYLEPPHVLSPKPWFRLRPTFNFLKFTHLQSPQCDGTIDLTILTVLLNDGSDLFFHDLRIRSNLPKSMVVIYFMIRASGVSNLKPFFLPYANLLESMICRHLSFSIDDSASTSGNLTFQPDQWFCGSFLDQRSRSPSGLRTSEISSLKLYFPSKYVDYCHMSSWIRRLRLTSGLYPESTGLRHVFSGSDGPDLLRTI